jgi:hypothetical protein
LESSNSSCPVVVLRLAIALCVLLRFAGSDFPFGIFKRLEKTEMYLDGF